MHSGIEHGCVLAVILQCIISFIYKLCFPSVSEQICFHTKVRCNIKWLLIDKFQTTKKISIKAHRAGELWNLWMFFYLLGVWTNCLSKDYIKKTTFFYIWGIRYTTETTWESLSFS